MDFVTEIYRFTERFPADERFGLTSQIRRAAISIPLNIAEGSGNESGKEFARFLHFARRSTYETITAIELAIRLGYQDQEQCQAILEEADQIAAMLVGLSKRVSSSSIQEVAASYELYHKDEP